MNNIDELIESGKKFNFENNSIIKSHGRYSIASDELLGWIAEVDECIKLNYGEDSSAYKLLKTHDAHYLNGYHKDDFDKEMAKINGALKACKKLPTNKKKKHIEEHPIMSLIKNANFWSVLVVISSAAFALGMYFGNSKFDKEKSELYNITINQEVEINSLKKEIVSKDSIISTFNEISQNTNIKVTD